jgi:molybdate transport system ATP-binding protein
LLLDEPFAALDQSLRQHMREELREMQQELKLPMLTITHDPADVAVLGDVVFNMQDGMIKR